MSCGCLSTMYTHTRDNMFNVYLSVKVSADFRQISMGHLSHWSGQQPHLLQRLQALGAQEMQWAQALDKGP